MPEFKEKTRIDDVTILRTTDMAVLCEIDGSEYWIPQSQIDDDSEVWEEGDEGLAGALPTALLLYPIILRRSDQCGGVQGR